ncbi:MAG TPA: hypothetical protein VMI92_13025 [Steroidobacteraceae bacterium]|nr:hypothetical protein [Steroidobacteraceae bacterium]
MNTGTRNRTALLAAVVVIVALAGGGYAWWWQQRPAAPVGELVRGGDGGGLPRATPQAEDFDPRALAAALKAAQDEGAHLILVSRHGHLVADYYASGYDAQRALDAGGFADALVGMAGGVALHEHLIDTDALRQFDPARVSAAIATAAKTSYAVYLSQHIWQPLNAADAHVAACCFQARASDWLRVAELLMQDGRFEGRDVLPKGWAAVMQGRDATGMKGLGVWLPPSVRGGEPFAGDGVTYLKGPQRWRLWLVPTLDLAILFGADDLPGGARWNETRLPNLVTWAVKERATHDPHAGMPGAR